ncbi:hypothetical protein EIP86_010064 [Pleurotus ostreatoroseus]|nr:hypothetical protein EIP86_010064 [Pleurotus ostreatoroseus]
MHRQEMDRKASNSLREAGSKHEHKERESEGGVKAFEEELGAVRVEPPSDDESDEGEAGSGQCSEDEDQHSEGTRSEKEYREDSRDADKSADDALSGFGDISLADAFNVAASTTEGNRLQPRRSRPPLPTQVRARRTWNEELKERIGEFYAKAPRSPMYDLLWSLLRPEPVAPGKDFEELLDRLKERQRAHFGEHEAEESVEDEDEDEEGSEGSSPEGSFLAHGREAGLL